MQSTLESRRPANSGPKITVTASSAFLYRMVMSSWLTDSTVDLLLAMTRSNLDQVKSRLCRTSALSTSGPATDTFAPLSGMVPSNLTLGRSGEVRMWIDMVGTRLEAWTAPITMRRVSLLALLPRPRHAS